jgi:hypothetical protein
MEELFPIERWSSSLRNQCPLIFTERKVAAAAAESTAAGIFWLRTFWAVSGALTAGHRALCWPSLHRG